MRNQIFVVQAVTNLHKSDTDLALWAQPWLNSTLKPVAFEAIADFVNSTLRHFAFLRSSVFRILLDQPISSVVNHITVGAVGLGFDS